MKSFIITVFCAVFLAFPAIACSHPDMYVHGFGGANYLTMSESTDMEVTPLPGYMVGVGVGFILGQMRFEFEGTYRHNDYKENVPIGPTIYFDRGHFDKITSFVNVFYDFPIEFFIDYLTPYIGVGGGHKFDMESIKIRFLPYSGGMWIDEYKSRVNGFSGQLILGLGLPLSEHTITKMEYRFLKDEQGLANHSFVLNFDRAF